jgi:O-antigen/teichoic acid export membrane protein
LQKSITDKFKEAGSHTIIYGLGSVLQKVLGFVLIPLYTKYYTAELYGTFALITLVGTIGGSIFYFGVHSALARSYYDYKDSYSRNRTVSTTFYILIFGALVQILLGFLLKEKISHYLFDTDKYSLHIFLILISSALNFITGLFYFLLRIERKSKKVIIFNLLKLMISVPLIIYFLIGLKLNVLAPILANLLTNLVMFGLLFLNTRKYFILAFSKKEFKLQMNWGIAVVISNFGVLSLNWVDRLFIEKYCSLSDVGIYSLGYTIGMLINALFILPFMQIWQPMRMEYRNDKNVDKFYSLVVTYYFFIGLIMAVALSIFSKEILLIIARREEYRIAYNIVPWIVFSYFFSGLSGLINHGLVFSRKIYKTTYITWLVAIFNIILNWWLIPIYGYTYAAYTTFLSFVIAFILRFLISQKYYKIQIEYSRLIKLIFSALIVIIGSYYLDSRNSSLLLLYKLLLFSAMIFSWFLFILNKNEKEIIINRIILLINK